MEQQEVNCDIMFHCFNEQLDKHFEQHDKRGLEHLFKQRLEQFRDWNLRR